jgi:hypothetical protein
MQLWLSIVRLSRGSPETTVPFNLVKGFHDVKNSSLDEPPTDANLPADIAFVLECSPLSFDGIVVAFRKRSPLMACPRLGMS